MVNDQINQLSDCLCCHCTSFLLSNDLTSQNTLPWAYLKQLQTL